MADLLQSRDAAWRCKVRSWTPTEDIGDVFRRLEGEYSIAWCIAALSESVNFAVSEMRNYRCTHSNLKKRSAHIVIA